MSHNKPKSKVDLKVFLAAVFTAAISVPITLLGYSFIVDRIANALIIASITLIIVGVLFVFVLAFRDKILERLRLSVRTGFDEVAEPLADGFSDAANGNWKSLANNSAELIRRLAGRYAWILSYQAMLSITGWLFVLFAALAGSAILIRQNALIEDQLKLMSAQNQSVKEQLVLLDTQNGKVDEQVALLKLQNSLIRDQNALSEASRRSHLAAEVVAVMDLVSRELQEADLQSKIDISATESPYYTNDWFNVGKEQGWDFSMLRPEERAKRIVIIAKSFEKKSETEEHPGPIILSRATCSRVVSILSSLRPYKFYSDEGKLVGPLSPERARLFLFLLQSGVFIESIGNLNVSYADFSGTTFLRQRISGINLRHSNFKGAHFVSVNFESCDLRDSDFSSAKVDCRFNRCVMPSSSAFAKSFGHYETEFCLFPERDWLTNVGKLADDDDSFACVVSHGVWTHHIEPICVDEPYIENGPDFGIESDVVPPPPAEFRANNQAPSE